MDGKEMNQLISLIRLTLAELIGQRIYKILLVSLFVIPWLLLVPTSLFLLDLDKVLIDMLFTTEHAWLTAYLFFIAVPLLTRDIEQGICSIFLTLPMPREKYLWARFTGVLCGILPLLFSFIISAILAFAFASGAWPGYIDLSAGASFSYGAVLILVPYIALAAVLFLIASAATGSAEITVFMFSVWLICWALPPVLEAMQNSEVAETTPAWIAMLLSSIHQLMPDLSSSQISLRLAHHLSLPPASVAGYCVQHLAYATLAMIAAAAVFKRRDLA